jgi:ribosomal protein S18 acetylase RimI-like enzyme
MRIRDMTGVDRVALQTLVREPGMFEPHEIRVAEELIDAHLAGSPDYRIHLAEASAGTADPSPGILGFVCYGHNPVTDAVYDVYWVVVGSGARRRGIGRALLEHAEGCVRGMGGRATVIETSDRLDYLPARALYESCGYTRVAEIADYYSPGHAMHIYMKTF